MVVRFFHHRERKKARTGLGFHELAEYIPKLNQAIFLLSDGLFSVVNGRTYIVGRDMITMTESIACHFVL